MIFVNGIWTCIQRLNSRGKWVDLLFCDTWEDAIEQSILNGYAVRLMKNGISVKEHYP